MITNLTQNGYYRFSDLRLLAPLVSRNLRRWVLAGRGRPRRRGATLEHAGQLAAQPRAIGHAGIARAAGIHERPRDRRPPSRGRGRTAGADRGTLVLGRPRYVDAVRRGRLVSDERHIHHRPATAFPALTGPVLLPNSHPGPRRPPSRGRGWTGGGHRGTLVFGRSRYVDPVRRGRLVPNGRHSHYRPTTPFPGLTGSVLLPNSHPGMIADDEHSRAPRAWEQTGTTGWLRQCTSARTDPLWADAALARSTCQQLLRAGCGSARAGPRQPAIQHPPAPPAGPSPGRWCDHLHLGANVDDGSRELLPLFRPRGKSHLHAYLGIKRVRLTQIRHHPLRTKRSNAHNRLAIQYRIRRAAG